jgi:hypothetical protein
MYPTPLVKLVWLINNLFGVKIRPKISIVHTSTSLFEVDFFIWVNKPPSNQNYFPYYPNASENGWQNGKV